MDKVELKIHIIPANRNISAIQDFDQSKDGSNFSDKKSINANKIAEGYSVIFLDNVFKYLDTKLFVGNLISIFTHNVPNTVFNISIHYHYRTNNSSYDYYDYDTARKIYELHGILMMLISSGQMKSIEYSESESLNNMFEDINNSDDDINDGSDDMKILSRYSSNQHNNQKRSSLTDEEKYIHDLLKNYNLDDDYDDEIIPKKKSKRKYYGRSRVFNNIKKPKDIVKKHNMLVTKSNSDIKDDIKIIKSFLKDFIPGNARWKKQFRNEILTRWLASYVITKKNMKKFAKYYRDKLDDDEVDENISTLAALFRSYQNSK